jgi:hypothetical protein
VRAPAAVGQYSAASSVLRHEVIEAKPIHPSAPLQALHKLSCVLRPSRRAVSSHPLVLAGPRRKRAELRLRFLRGLLAELSPAGVLDLTRFG